MEQEWVFIWVLAPFIIPLNNSNIHTKFQIYSATDDGSNCIMNYIYITSYKILLLSN